MSKLSRKKFKRGESSGQPSQQHGVGEGQGTFTQHSPIGGTHGTFTQHSPIGGAHGTFTQQSPVRDIHGTSTQQSPVHGIHGTFTQQSPTSKTTNVISHDLRLKNVQNSCFANAAIQVFYAIKEFREFILSRRYWNLSGKITHGQLTKSGNNFFIFLIQF